MQLYPCSSIIGIAFIAANMPPHPNTAGWDDFRLIKAIADAGSLPAAAAALGINHSTLFRRLRQIEAALGATLFERHRSGYVPTVAGEEVVALAQRLADDITGLTRRLSGQALAPQGEVRVATNDSLLVHLLTPLFAGFRQAYPRIRLDIVVGNPALNLSRRDADVAIRATDNPPDNLVGRRAACIAWALYGRAGEPGLDTIKPADRSWVSLGENLAGLKAVRFVADHVPAENIAYRVNTVLGLAEAIEAGLGIGHLPCFVGGARPALARLAPPEPEYATDLWLLTHPDLRHAPRVRALLDFLAAGIVSRRALIEGDVPTD
jgi:DNA-binding transcriptional LysR family regulator